MLASIPRQTNTDGSDTDPSHLLLHTGSRDRHHESTTPALVNVSQEPSTGFAFRLMYAHARFTSITARSVRHPDVAQDHVAPTFFFPVAQNALSTQRGALRLVLLEIA